MCRTRVARSPWKIAVATSRINPAQVRLSVLESSRTSNGLTLKAVRHPRGTLINYIFTGSSYDRQSTFEVGGIIQYPLINYIFTRSSYNRQSTLEVGGIIQYPPEF